MKLGMIWPLPEQKIRDFAKSVTKLVVVEELDSFIENHCRQLGIACEGKETFPCVDEFSQNLVAEKLGLTVETRVNVGIELVADRDLLCLDEPDQGLSPNYKHELFEIMRNLAHTYGKTVLSIIHDVSEIDMFDQVVMLAKVDGVGRLAFSGTPEEAREYFGVDIRDAYALLERDPKRFVK